MDPTDYAGEDDTTWYLAQSRGQKAGPRLVALCREIAVRQRVLLENTDKCISVFQWGGDEKDRRPGEHCAIEENLVTFNAAQNAVETVFSKVIKSRISPMPLTNGGGYLARHRAKQMGKAIEGVLDDNDADRIEEDVVMDALVTDHGAGACQVMELDDEIKIIHIPVEDVWFDYAETRQRQPRSCYKIPRDGMDKYVAVEFFAGEDTRDREGHIGTPESRRQAILKASHKPEYWRTEMSPLSSSNRVDIFEAWHLPSGYEEVEEEYEDDDGEKKTRTRVKHDGRHTVCVEGEEGTLVDEPWGEDFFPILLYTPRKRRRDIWGLSLMRDMIAQQREYEKVTKKIQNQHQKMGISGFMSPKSAEMNYREMKAGTDAAGWVAEFDGPTPPVPMVVEPVAQGTYAYADSLPRNMLERRGISTLAAASQLPAGLQQASGKALQVFEDFEDVRLLPYHRERERFKVSLSWIIVCMAKRIVDRVGSYKSRYQGKRGIEPIDWKDVLMDRKDFVLKVFPISALSKQPSAKFAQLNELLDRGAITVEQFKRLYELPDLEAENELDTADTDIIDRHLDIMVTTGRYIAPEPDDDLALIIQRASKFYNLCRTQEVPENRLQLIRNYKEDTKSLMDQAKAAAQAAMPPPAPPMGPPGMPGPGGPPPMGGPPGMVPPAGPLPGMPPPGAPPMPMAA